MMDRMYTESQIRQAVATVNAMQSVLSGIPLMRPEKEAAYLQLLLWALRDGGHVVVRAEGESAGE